MTVPLKHYARRVDVNRQAAAHKGDSGLFLHSLSDMSLRADAPFKPFLFEPGLSFRQRMLLLRPSDNVEDRRGEQNDGNGSSDKKRSFNFISLVEPIWRFFSNLF